MKQRKRKPAIPQKHTHKRTVPAKKRSAVIITGTFCATARGFGFIRPDEAYTEKYPQDLFVPAEKTGGAMNGDAVRAAAEPDRRPSDDPRHAAFTCRVLAITKRAASSVVGVLEEEEAPGRRRPRLVVRPDDRRMAGAVRVHGPLPAGVSVSDKVELRITRYPTDEDATLAGEITRGFGNAESRVANYEAILAEEGVRVAFPDAVTLEAERLSAEPIDAAGRLDLRDEMIFTVDGADAKDLDDAVSLDCTQDGYRLGVHIADVSHYVRPQGSVDAEAFLRGTSIYFIDRVVPMLPQALSNGSCSLNGGVDRYALTAYISLSKDGDITGCTLHESIIRSKVRGVYAELNDILKNGEDSSFFAKYSMLFPQTVPPMVRLYEILSKKHRAAGALDFETPEPYFIMNEQGDPVSVRQRERGIFERVIEQFMLTANEGVAQVLTERGMPCVYRVHDTPPDEKLQDFLLLAHGMGLDTAALSAGEVTPLKLQKLMTQAEEKGVASAVSMPMLRTLAKARYQSEPAMHFGLATALYCHFTSPIRRYPDLTVHRMVKAMLHGKTSTEELASAARVARRAAEQATVTELAAMHVEREIEDLYRVIYMRSQVGAELDGMISSVCSFGFFVLLDNSCEGLVPLSSLDGLFTFDEKHATLQCGSRLYRIGDRVRVRVERADLAARRIDFSVLV